ncbi:hypothetical protein LIER_32573 [Lithospermum erythrorhizon]|uniref:RNase H type-1 domain-containing protein n=1 Tax=Lithospermum erythrorhizon TaxID=34254 RepID=A0AAV3RXM7_LITER
MTINIINVDAGWRKESKSGALGIVARDETGVANGARCKQVEFVSIVLVAEALAIREGQHFAWEKSCTRVELETASNVLVDIINGARRTYSSSLESSRSVGGGVAYHISKLALSSPFKRLTLNLV